jgi:hypothetical protein
MSHIRGAALLNTLNTAELITQNASLASSSQPGVLSHLFEAYAKPINKRKKTHVYANLIAL